MRCDLREGKALAVSTSPAVFFDQTPFRPRRADAPRRATDGADGVVDVAAGGGRSRRGGLARGALRGVRSKSPGFGQNRAGLNTGQTCPNRAECGRDRPASAQIGPDWAKTGAEVGRIDQVHAGFAVEVAVAQKKLSNTSATPRQAAAPASPAGPASSKAQPFLFAFGAPRQVHQHAIERLFRSVRLKPTLANRCHVGSCDALRHAATVSLAIATNVHATDIQESSQGGRSSTKARQSQNVMPCWAHHPWALSTSSRSARTAA